MVFAEIEYPEWLYEALPYLYVVGGSLFALLGGSALHVFGGVALASLGVAVWRARRTYRRAMLQRSRRRR